MSQGDLGKCRIAWVGFSRWDFYGGRRSELSRGRKEFSTFWGNWPERLKHLIFSPVFRLTWDIGPELLGFFEAVPSFGTLMAVACAANRGLTEDSGQDEVVE